MSETASDSPNVRKPRTPMNAVAWRTSVTLRLKPKAELFHRDDAQREAGIALGQLGQIRGRNVGLQRLAHDLQRHYGERRLPRCLRSLSNGGGGHAVRASLSLKDGSSRTKLSDCVRQKRHNAARPSQSDYSPSFLA